MVLPGDVLELLIQYSSLILHCAGLAKGHGSVASNAIPPLERLQLARKNLSYEISCSTFSNSDEFAPGTRVNCTGTIGLIVVPNSADSVPLASPTDAGTLIDEINIGKRIFARRNVSISDLRDSIINRDVNSYNEWVVSNYSVHGILWVSRNIQCTHNGSIIDFTQAQIYQAFQDLPHYWVYDNKIWLLEYDESTMKFSPKGTITIADIYKCQSINSKQLPT